MAYVGPEADLYIRLDSSLAGLSVGLQGGSVIWLDSWTISLNPGETMGQAVAEFEDQTDANHWLQRRLSAAERGLMLGDYLGPDFVSAYPGSSQLGVVKLKGCTANKGVVELNLENQTGETGELSGILLIHIKTRKVIRATLNGKEAYPEREGLFDWRHR